MLDKRRLQPYARRLLQAPQCPQIDRWASPPGAWLLFAQYPAVYVGGWSRYVGADGRTQYPRLPTDQARSHAGPSTAGSSPRNAPSRQRAANLPRIRLVQPRYAVVPVRPLHASRFCSVIRHVSMTS